ncbi:glycosyltransferase family 2 protein [Shewanella inventionis]|uniref:glycosyltransferase family 2 protein n=1 Tax=Shewanella inventionis TaxID=1738770 RepID=UPI001CBB9628|nr:glycosyltransferase family A protein [Shewanella inventionis]UAL43679.1 glycosyltransferase family 2 protein [Shewanella inventionis]
MILVAVLSLQDKNKLLSPLKLAVIVATKNRCELLISRALESIKNQTRRPNYLIVCDDSDSVFRQANFEAVNQFTSPDYKTLYLENSRTRGASGTWNSAVNALLAKDESPCEIAIAFLDDDDTWSPDYLEYCLREMQEQSLDMVACGINRIEGKHLDLIQNPAPEKLTVSSFLVGNPGIQGSNLFLRLSTFLEAGGFDESLSSSTDRDLCIRLAEMKTVRYRAIPDYLVNHYAEASRSRLSSPGTEKKQSGLTAFWQKYHSRMSADQRGCFSQRAQDLFGWEPSDANVCNPLVEVKNKALVLILNVQMSAELIEKLIEFFLYFSQLDLVGLDIVFQARKEDLEAHTSTIVLRDLGVGCFPVESVELLHLYGSQVSKLRPGSRVLALNGFIGSALKAYSDTEVYLSSCGALELPEYEKQVKVYTKLDIDEINKHIHELRIASAKHRVTQNFKSESLRVLGYGSEAIVFTDGQTVFKCIDYWKTRTPIELFGFLRDSGPTWSHIPGLYPLNSVVKDGSWVLITYSYEASEPYRGGYEALVIQLINGCTQAGIVCNNIHPKNLIHTDEEVKLIDYGSDIRPWNEVGFEHMARRAYLSCWYAASPDLKVLMRQSLNDEDMPELEGFAEFRAKLDYPVHNPSRREFTLLPASKAEPFELIIGVITADPLMLLPLISSLRVLAAHPSIRSLSVIVLCNGCSALALKQLLNSTSWQLPNFKIISEQQQSQDAGRGYFGPEIMLRATGQVGIAKARTMLQRYLGERLARLPDSIGWILDDDMRLDIRACDYIKWLPLFRDQDVDILLGAYEGSSPNPPLNGLRVQLMDLVHNLAWMAELPEESILPDRSSENDLLRSKFSDYYYDLSRKHTAHLESPLWLERSYEFETVREARARLISGAERILNGTPITRSIVVPECLDPLKEAKDSVNRGGCTFILNHEALLHTPNLIPALNGKEARRSDMVWAIINRYYRGMTIKSVSFPVYHVGRFSDRPSVNTSKVQGEIVGSALYAGLTDFLRNKPEHQLRFSAAEVDAIYEMTIDQMTIRISALRQSSYRIKGLVNNLKCLSLSDDLMPLISCIEKELSLIVYREIENAVKGMSKNEISHFLRQLVPVTEAYSRVSDASRGTLDKFEFGSEGDDLMECIVETTN